MSVVQPVESRRDRRSTAPAGRLFVLDLGGGHVFSMNPDGSGKEILVSDCRWPDGVAVDVDAGHIYWTNMGNSPKANDGSIERADFDGRNRTTIVPQGATFTPKQIHLDKENSRLYWSDREGMRVMRANTDGSNIETLVQTGIGDADRLDATKWCVGIAIDPRRREIYWTQKGPDDAGLGRIFRANIEVPKGETPANRSDIEVWFEHLPEPIDLELDLSHRVMYWTDRGDPPRGNTVNRASVDNRPDAPEIVFTHLMEGIGISLDVPHNRMFMTDLAGTIYTCRMDGSDKQILAAAQGNLAGIQYVEMFAKEK